MSRVCQKRLFSITTSCGSRPVNKNSITGTINKRLKCSENNNYSSLSTNISNLCDVNSLPTDVLFLIFNRIHLKHRITRLSIVCKRWNCVIVEMCAMKSSLIINLFNDYRRDPSSLFMDEDLERCHSIVAVEEMESVRVCARINDRGVLQCPNLSSIFVGITHLVIRCNDDSSEQNEMAIHLFLGLLHQQWPFNLNGLTLWKSTSITDPTFLPRICYAINSASWNAHLKRLDLFFRDLEQRGVDYGLLNLENVLPNLERFFMNFYCANIMKILEILGGVDNFSRITKESTIYVKDLQLSSSQHYLNFMRSLNSDVLYSLARSVTHLRITRLADDNWLSFICDHFYLLKYLQINCCWSQSCSIQLSYLLSLTKLKYLNELRFHNFILLPGLFPPNFVLPTVKKLTIVEPRLLWWFRKCDQYKPNNVDTNRQSPNQKRRKCFNADRYCSFLSKHFPSVERLVLVCCEKNVLQAKRQLNKFAYIHFNHLQKLCLVLQAKF